MHTTGDEELAKDFSRRCALAKEDLRQEMIGHGMSEADGWRIAESTRHLEGGTQMVFRPIHRELLADPTMQRAVLIEERARSSVVITAK